MEAIVHGHIFKAASLIGRSYALADLEHILHVERKIILFIVICHSKGIRYAGNAYLMVIAVAKDVTAFPDAFVHHLLAASPEGAIKGIEDAVPDAVLAVDLRILCHQG